MKLSNVKDKEVVASPKKPLLVADIKSAHDARLAVFERVSGILNEEYTNRFKSPHASNVWNASDMIPYVDGDYSIDVSSLQFECNLGNQISFSYSISITLGEVRIGIMVPEELMKTGDNVLYAVDPYPLNAKDPQKIIRSLNPQGYLLDHVFNARFGSLEITKAALESRHKDSIEINTLADAVARELIHINHSLMHAISNTGFLVLADTIYSQNQFAWMVLHTKEQPNNIIRTLGIQQSQLYIMSRHSYNVMVPVGDIEKLQPAVDKLNEDFQKETYEVNDKVTLEEFKNH